MSKPTFLVTVPPGTTERIPAYCTTAHLAYRLGRGPHLFRVSDGPPPQGGVMVLTVAAQDCGGNLNQFYQEVLRECAVRRFQGVLCDCEGARSPAIEQLFGALADRLSQRNLSVFLPEEYAHCSHFARILVSSALSGGSLELRLKECAERFGAGRTVLAIEPMAEDFPLPSPAGSGTSLTAQELAQLRERLSPSVFFSSELCARYFTYMSREHGAHFILFDDGDTIRKKLELVVRLELWGANMVWPDIAPWLPQLGLENLAQGRL